MKVGDLVRCTKDNDEHQGRIGLVVEVEWHDFGEGHLPRCIKDGFWVCYIGNCDWDYHWDNEFEVISESRQSS